MKALLALMLIVSIAGCTTNKIEPDILNSEIVMLEPIQMTASLPNKPEMKVIRVEGVSYGAFNLQGVNALNTYSRQAEANTKSLNLLVETHNDLIANRNEIADLAHQHEKRGNSYNRLYVETYNELQEERAYNKVKSIVLQVLLVAALLL